MMFNRGPFRPPTPRVRVAVFAIGQRAFITGAGDRPLHATLTDDAGHTPVGDIRDGAEVAILAWRPAPGDATRYCVRVMDSGVEGWLPVRNLRNKQVATVPAPPASIAPPQAIVAAATGHRFGQRR
jgi:hypothetical protein